MGSLIKETPYSEVTATLEILDHHGVGRDHLTQFRAANPEAQRYVALALKKLDIFSGEKKWREEDRVIYFSVTSDGTTGENWIKRLEDKGFRVSGCAKHMLRSPSFVPMSGGITEVAVLKSRIFEDNDLITKRIRAEAGVRKLATPNAELACLIREKFTDEEIEAMGLWFIMTMHEPINDPNGDSCLLRAERSGDGRWFGAYYDQLGRRWTRGNGFAFVVSQS